MWANLYGTIPPCCNCGKASCVVLHRHSSSWNNGQLYSVYNGATASSFCFLVHSWATSCFPQCLLKYAATYAFSLDCGDLCPLPINSFLPQCYIVAGIWDCKYIPCQRPAHSPHRCLEVMQRQSLPLITFLTLDMVDKHPHLHYNKVMMCEKQALMTIRKHRSWCLLPQDCWWKTTLNAHEKTLVMVFSSSRLLFEEQSSRLVRKHRLWCLLPQDCWWKTKLKVHENHVLYVQQILTWVQITTVPSCDALAIVDFGRPRLGAQATSLTQSVCLERGGKQSSLQFPPVYFHTLMVLSHPPEASFWMGGEMSPTKEPGAAAGAQETDVTPTGCAGSILAFSHAPSAFCVRTEMVPSDEPHARHNPNSCGAQHMLFTEESCSWKTCSCCVYTLEWYKCCSIFIEQTNGES